MKTVTLVGRLDAAQRGSKATSVCSPPSLEPLTIWSGIWESRSLLRSNAKTLERVEINVSDPF